MTTWREIPKLLAPRVLEIEAKLGTILVRFDNELYLRVEGSGRGIRPYVELRFALFEALDGEVMTLPMAEAARQVTGGRGYRFTMIVGLPFGNKEADPGVSNNLEVLKSKLGAKSGRLFLAVAVRPDRLVGTPMWSARAEFTVEGNRHRLLQPPDYSSVAENIRVATDDVKRYLIDSIAVSKLRP